MQVNETTAEKWITKPEAAELLELSPRAFERIVAKGQIEKKMLPRQGTEPARAVYRHTSVIKLREQRANGITPTALTPARQFDPRDVDGFPMPTGNGSADLERLQRHFLNRFDSEYEKVKLLAGNTPKQWLTPKEAAEESGLPWRFLIRLCLAGRIGCNVAAGRKPKFRIHRDELGTHIVDVVSLSALSKNQRQETT